MLLFASPRVELPDEIKGVAEMYGYSFGAAAADMWHLTDHTAMLYPSYLPYTAAGQLNFNGTIDWLNNCRQLQPAEGVYPTCRCSKCPPLWPVVQHQEYHLQLRQTLVPGI